MITINLFDFNFRQSVCSVAFQTPKHVQYVRDLLEFDGITLFTDEYINDPVVDKVKSRYKIGWLREPYCLHPLTYERCLENLHKFDAVLTYYKPFIGKNGNFPKFPYDFIYVPYGGIWIDRKSWGLRTKTKNVSMLFGEKNQTSGHQIRHEIFKQIGYRHGIDYYGKYGTPTNYSADTKLMVHEDYRFSIVIETCREEGLFTEILLDCMAVGTIPIFWGAPDIHNYFDGNGILTFETVYDLDGILRSLTNNYEVAYNDMLDAVGYNLHLAGKYAVTEDWIYEHVLERFPT